MIDLSGYYKSPETRARKIAGWRAARTRTHAGEGFIYLAAIGHHFVKIGFSLDPAKRVRNLSPETHFPGKRRLLATIPGTWAQEKALHRALGYGGSEYYPRSILSHPALPEELRVAA